MLPLPIDPGWRATVEATIARLEHSTTLYDQLRLAGWRAHLETIKAAEAYWNARGNEIDTNGETPWSI